MDNDRLLRPDQVADWLGISRRKVYYLAANAEFECLKIGGSLRILTSSVEEYIENQIRAFDQKKGWSD